MGIYLLLTIFSLLLYFVKRFYWKKIFFSLLLYIFISVILNDQPINNFYNFFCFCSSWDIFCPYPPKQPTIVWITTMSAHYIVCVFQRSQKFFVWLNCFFFGPESYFIRVGCDVLVKVATQSILDTIFFRDKKTHWKLINHIFSCCIVAFLLAKALCILKWI